MTTWSPSDPDNLSRPPWGPGKFCERRHVGMNDFIAGIRRGEMAADHFTLVANLVARNPKLHISDKGLFLQMASHREGWIITEEGLAAQCADGIKTIRASLRRLREQGFIYRSEERLRYPAGTVNSGGVDISGRWGPYRWYVTDKPDEIAVILTRYAEEQKRLNISAGQDQRPKRQVVPTCDDASDEADHSEQSPPAQKAAGSDLEKQTFSQVVTSGPKGSSIEDQELQEDHTTKSIAAAPLPVLGQKQACGPGRLATDQPQITSQRGPAELVLGGDHQTAREAYAAGVMTRRQAQEAIRQILNDWTAPESPGKAAQIAADGMSAGAEGGNMNFAVGPHEDDPAPITHPSVPGS